MININSYNTSSCIWFGWRPKCLDNL